MWDHYLLNILAVCITEKIFMHVCKHMYMYMYLRTYMCMYMLIL